MSKQISVERIYNLDLNSDQTEANSNLISKELFFDKNKNLIKEVSYNPPGLTEQTTAYKYDEQNRLIEECCYDADDDLLENTKFFWDGENRKIKEEKHYLDGSSDTTIFTYNKNGDLVEKVQTDDEDEVEAKEVFVYQDNLLLEHLKYGEDEELEEKKTFTIEEGKSRTEIHWDGFEQTETKKEFRFTEDGRVEKELFFNSKGELTKKIEYLKFHKEFILEFMEEDQYHQNTTKLVYDEHNSVILQEQFNKEGQLNHRIERTFNQDRELTEVLTFVNSGGQGVNLHFKEVHKYEYFE